MVSPASLRDPHLVAPLPALDEAIERVRETAPSRLLTCAGPGLCITWLALITYYCERVESIPALRPWLSLGFVLAFGWRALVLGRYAGECARDHDAPQLAAAQRTGRAALLGAAALLGIELWLWLWLLVIAVQVELWLVLPALPLIALRGATAPSWLAACDTLGQAGPLRALAHAVRSGRGLRLTGIGCELFMLLGSAALLVNLGALLAALVSLLQDALGLELALVRAFLSPDNHFMLLLLAGLSLSAFEPLRAALSGVLYASTRSDADVRVLEEALARCIAEAKRGRAPLLSAGLLALALLGCSNVRAQDRADNLQTGRPTGTLVIPPPAFEAECDEVCQRARARDDALLVTLVAVLARDEFRELSGEETPHDVAPSATKWLDKLLRWLSGADQASDPPLPATRKLSLPELRSGFAAALLLCLASGLWMMSRPRWAHWRRRERPVSPNPPAQQPGAEQLAQALVLLEHDPQRGLRALYLACLHTLAERGVIRLAEHLTNGQYVQRVPDGPLRGALSELTGLFDRACYGHRLPSPSELARARLLAVGLATGAQS